MPEPFRSPAALARFVLTAAVGLGLDLYVKWFSFKTLSDGVIALPDGKVEVLARPPYQFIRGWLEFEVIPNQGAVFGLGQGQRVLFVIVSVAAVAFLFYLFAASGRRKIYQITLGMLMAGVLGNLYDRLTLGYVRDMIHALPRWPKLFPYIFNVADTLLCCGVGIMILFSFLPAAKNSTAKNQTLPDAKPRNA
jgi:signal peptidase II